MTHAAPSKAAEAAYKAGVRAMWALGDYPKFATDLVWDLGAAVVAACNIAPGQRVLDVAAGSGNAALRAAKAGALVVAVDLTPENFEAGRQAARQAGVAIEWVEGDAEDLPFPTGAFDVVTSSVGAMWAPNHQRVADELLRVCSPGATIGMVNFAADGLIVDFLNVFAEYAPPPPAWASPPPLWGDRAHIKKLFGDRVSDLNLTPGTYTERVPGGPQGYCEYYKETFGPVIATYAGLADDPQTAAALDQGFLAFATEHNAGPPDGPAELTFEYVIVTARAVDPTNSAQPERPGP